MQQRYQWWRYKPSKEGGDEVPIFQIGIILEDLSGTVGAKAHTWDGMW